MGRETELWQSRLTAKRKGSGGTSMGVGASASRRKGGGGTSMGVGTSTPRRKGGGAVGVDAGASRRKGGDAAGMGDAEGGGHGGPRHSRATASIIDLGRFYNWTAHIRSALMLSHISLSLYLYIYNGKSVVTNINLRI